MQAVPVAAHDGLIELELWMVVNHHMAAGNQTLVPARTTNALNHRAISLHTAALPFCIPLYPIKSLSLIVFLHSCSLNTYDKVNYIQGSSAIITP